MWRDKKAHIAEEFSTSVMVPAEIDRALRSEFMACYTSSTVLFCLCQRHKRGFGISKDAQQKLSRDDVALIVASIDSALALHALKMLPISLVGR